MSTYAMPTGARSLTVPALMGRVLSLVAAAIGFTVLGTFIGEGLSSTSSWIFYGVAIAMLFAPTFVSVLRTGPIGMGWLMGIGFALGLALAPALNEIAEVRPGLITEAAGLTALITVAMAATGFAIDKDLSGWLRTLAIIVNVCVLVSLGALLFGGLGSLSPLVSLIILGASALTIMVDFNVVRHRADEDDVVWLATSMFVSILNIFLSLLNLLGRD